MNRTYKAVQVTQAGKLEVVERAIVEPAFGQVRIRVASLSAQARYAAGTREILECWLQGRPMREEYIIVDGGKLAGTGAQSYTVQHTGVQARDWQASALRLRQTWHE